MSKEWPLVTFALFTYNQEKYIRQAIEAALAQDYPNLEVIISDDCSQDRTVEIAQGAIDSFNSGHSVFLRATRSNLGPFRHVLDVASIARGELIVLAAGDDLSSPRRVSRLVEEWTRTSAWGFSSNYDVIDASGNLVKENTRTEGLFSLKYDLRRYFRHGADVGIVHGATSAYSAELFKAIDKEKAPWILSEDGAFSLVVNFLNRRVVHIDESLVSYRAHSDALTNVRPSRKLTEAELIKFVDNAAAYAASCRNRAQFFLDFARASDGISTREIDCPFIEADMARHDFRANWIRIGFRKRIDFLRCHPAEWRWMLPRLFGLRFYVRAKLLRDRLSNRAG